VSRPVVSIEPFKSFDASDRDEDEAVVLAALRQFQKNHKFGTQDFSLLLFIVVVKTPCVFIVWVSLYIADSTTGLLVFLTSCLGH
jgi:hypothetical protein